MHGRSRDLSHFGLTFVVREEGHEMSWSLEQQTVLV
jgi:hypothetical protein